MEREVKAEVSIAPDHAGAGEIGTWSLVCQSEITIDDPECPKDVAFRVCTPGRLATVEIVKNGATIYRCLGKDELDRTVALTVPDRAPTSDAGDCYYLRARQADGAMAWVSPGVTVKR